MTVVLFAAATLLANWDLTRNNVGLVLGWPMQLAERLFGPVQDRGTVAGALGYTFYNLLNLLFLYVVAAIILREGRGKKQD